MSYIDKITREKWMDTTEQNWEWKSPLYNLLF